MAFFTILEAQVKNAFELIASERGPDEAKGLQQVLQDGQEFKNSGLTPVYIYDDETETIIATSIERMTKKLDG